MLNEISIFTARLKITVKITFLGLLELFFNTGKALGAHF